MKKESLSQNSETTTQSTQSSPRNAGGFFIAFGVMTGTIGGGLMGQATLGFLTGLALGIVIATVIWLRGR